ncbi:hypothetical protein [Burkholderia sp. Bp8998]|uniref:hypothetical protein n=1 Tax=Burkholderia sp. Bp8998 TaxID=2184557 RepID=UPI000F599CCE|nr:hypothetical protein [Burkholderia sp. Bp8998]
MDSAYLKIIGENDLLFDDPIAFTRLPTTGEWVFLPPTLYEIKGVTHYWTDAGPVAQLLITEADNQAEIFVNSTAPTQQGS